MSWIDAYRTEGALEGRCTCGAVTVTVDGGYVAAVGLCHCDMCRRWAGGIFACFEADADAVSAMGPVTRHATSHFAERAFCATCGGNLWMRNTDAPDAVYDLMPGLFDAAAEFPLVSEIYHDKAPAYATLAGDHRRATRAAYEAANAHVEGDAT